jgi:hypothetical protein
MANFSPIPEIFSTYFLVHPKPTSSEYLPIFPIFSWVFAIFPGIPLARIYFFP